MKEYVSTVERYTMDHGKKFKTRTRYSYTSKNYNYYLRVNYSKIVYYS